MDIANVINEVNKTSFKIPSRRKKMTFRDFDTIKAEFTSFHKNKYGYVYRMTKELNFEQKEYIGHFKNTKIALVHPTYAPELKTSLVLIADKCLR